MLLIYSFVSRPPPELAILPLDHTALLKELSGGRLVA